MSEFKDSNGKTWRIALDAPTIRAVRAQCNGLDLANFDGKTYERLAVDPCLLVDVLWCICREQADKDGVTDIQFGRALVGDAIEDATNAMLAGIADFFPKSRAAMISAMVTTNRQIRDQGIAKAIARLSDPALATSALAAMDAQFDSVIETALTRFASATSSPVSAESVHAA